MLTVTDKATAYLREALTRKKEGTPEALRVVYTEEGYELTLDDPKEGDHIFEQEGQNYLLIDSEVDEGLGEEATLDLQQTPHGTSLTLLGALSPEPEPQPEAEAETKTKTKAKAKAKSEAEAESDADAESKTKTTASADAEPKPKPKTKAKTKTKTKAEAETEPQP